MSNIKENSSNAECEDNVDDEPQPVVAHVSGHIYKRSPCQGPGLHPKAGQASRRFQHRPFLHTIRDHETDMRLRGDMVTSIQEEVNSVLVSAISQSRTESLPLARSRGLAQQPAWRTPIVGRHRRGSARLGGCSSSPADLAMTRRHAAGDRNRQIETAVGQLQSKTNKLLTK